MGTQQLNYEMVEFANDFQAFVDACELSNRNSCHHNEIWMAGAYQGMIIWRYGNNLFPVELLMI
jgi:hypothetical protein